MLQGLNADYLTTDNHKTKSGETVLIYFTASGVGQVLTQINKLYGVKVFGLTSTPQKAEVALKNGASQVFLYADIWKEKVMDSS